MVSMVACLYVLVPRPGNPRTSRAAFCHALRRIQYNGMHVAGDPRDTVRIDNDDQTWTKAQVRAALGRPDEVDALEPISKNNNETQRPRVRWLYGARGRHSFPTLGAVDFDNDKVLEVYGSEGEPPSATVISEADLVKGMRDLFRDRQGFETDADPLHLIRAANILIGMRQSKALAVLDEYSRISTGPNDEIWLYYLVRVAFRSKLVGGTFLLPAGGNVSPIPDAQLRRWPTYPVVSFRNVPLAFQRFDIVTGSFTSFKWYLLDHQAEFVLRRETIVPPNDPFLAFKELKDSQVWPLICEYCKSGMITRSQSGVEGSALVQILALVRNAYHLPGDESNTYGLTGSDYDRLHRQFLRHKCHWDAARQDYVRD